MAAHVTIGGVDYPVIFDGTGEEVNILQLNELTNPAVPDVWFYAAIEGDPDPDRKMSYTNLVQFLALKNNERSKGNLAVTAGLNSKILFQVAGVNAPLASANYSLQIFDPNNAVGVQLISNDAAGFTINCQAAGVIHYIATLNT
jgi:hypothetical protein